MLLKKIYFAFACLYQFTLLFAQLPKIQDEREELPVIPITAEVTQIFYDRNLCLFLKKVLQRYAVFWYSSVNTIRNTEYKTNQEPIGIEISRNLINTRTASQY